jgi:hypothetical protein
MKDKEGGIKHLSSQILQITIKTTKRTSQQLSKASHFSK